MKIPHQDLGFPYLEEGAVFQFPSTAMATQEGIVAMGGNLSPGMLLSAYTQGIFPWYAEDSPILWWSPDPRFILLPEELHVPKSLERILRKEKFSFTLDNHFLDVITSCSSIPRQNEKGTWVTEGMIEAYTVLQKLGYAHSIEVYQEGTIVGGLYGVSLGRVFFGESMYTLVSDASKAALVVLVRYLAQRGFRLIDSQVHTAHMERFGARNIPRSQYLKLLKEFLGYPTYKGPWSTLFSDFPTGGLST